MHLAFHVFLPKLRTVGVRESISGGPPYLKKRHHDLDHRPLLTMLWVSASFLLTGSLTAAMALAHQCTPGYN